MDGHEEPKESTGISPQATVGKQVTGQRFWLRLVLLVSILAALLFGASSGLHLLSPGQAAGPAPFTDAPTASVSKTAVPVADKPKPSASGPSASGTASSPARKVSRKVPAAPPLHLTVGSAGIDLPVLPLTPTGSDLASHSIVPPMTFDAYWLTSFGSPGDGSNNTTYIVGHSGINQDAPFNRLSTSVKVGDTFTLTTSSGRIKYVVESVVTHNKDTLAQSDIWRIVPNKVVLISCYTEDPWGKNVVVSAAPAT